MKTTQYVRLERPDPDDIQCVVSTPPAIGCPLQLAALLAPSGHSWGRNRGWPTNWGWTR